MSKALRVAGTALAAAGLLAAAWAFTVWQWRDPFTAVTPRTSRRTWRPSTSAKKPAIARQSTAEHGTTRCKASAAQRSDTVASWREATRSGSSACPA